MLFVLLAIALGVIFAFICKKQFDLMRFARRGIPGPIPIFPFGNAIGWTTRTRNIVYDMDDVYRQFKGKAPFCGFQMMSTPYLLVTDAELVKQLIIKDFRKFRNNDFVVDPKDDPLIARNPFWLKDDVWKEKRVDFAPSMTPVKLKSMYPLILNGVESLIDYLMKQKGEVNARDVFGRYTCDTVISCIYGLEAHSFLSEKPFMLTRGQEFIEGIAKSSLSFSSGRVMPQQVHEFFLSVAKDAMRIRSESIAPRDDFLSHILSVREKRGMTDLDVAADCATVFLDGYETTSLTLHFAFYELGKNQKAQEKLRNEIKDNLDGEQTMAYEKLLELPYLDQVFYEALRLYSPVLYSTKICSEKMELSGVKGHSVGINPGDTFWIPFFSIHRDPEYYPNPNLFIPERFDPENGGVKAFKDRYVLLPFGDGPRICVGQRFAFMQVKAAIAEIVAKFKVSVSKDTPQQLTIGADKFLSDPNCKLMLRFERI